MIDSLASFDEYKYYNPICFILLKQWLQFLKERWNDEKLKITKPPKELREVYDFFNCEKVFNKSYKQITSKQIWTQFVHQWFDAFKTLKFIHFYDKKFDRLNYHKLLKEINFVKVNNSSLQTFIDKYDKN